MYSDKKDTLHVDKICKALSELIPIKESSTSMPSDILMDDTHRTKCIKLVIDLPKVHPHAKSHSTEVQHPPEGEELAPAAWWSDENITV